MPLRSASRHNKLRKLVMDDETFNKLYFVAALGGTKKVGELMIDLVHAGHERLAFRLIRMHSPGAVSAPTVDNVTKDRPCDWSPYGYCFTTDIGKTIEHHLEDTQSCIWCERLYSKPNMTKPEIATDWAKYYLLDNDG